MKSEIIGKVQMIERGESSSLIKVNGRYYTVFGRMFAVAGDHRNTTWDDVCKIERKYRFMDFGSHDQLDGMYRDYEI